jgi:hypothetical protein
MDLLSSGCACLYGEFSANHEYSRLAHYCNLAARHCTSDVVYPLKPAATPVQIAWIGRSVSLFSTIVAVIIALLWEEGINTGTDTVWYFVPSMSSVHRGTVVCSFS